MTYPDLLEAWFSGWTLSERVSPGVEFARSPDYVDKRSAWVIVEGSAAIGQVTVWETGECDVSFGLFDGEAEAEVASSVLSTPQELIAQLQSVVRRVSVLN